MNEAKCSEMDTIIKVHKTRIDALFRAGVFDEKMTAQIQAAKDAFPKPE